MPEFNHEMLTLGRESRGMTQAALAKGGGFSQPKVSRFESGLAVPDASEIERLAEALAYPPHFFLRSSVTTSGGTEAYHERSRQRLGILKQRKTHAGLRLRRMEIAQLLGDVEIDAREGFTSMMEPDDYDGDIETIAERVRALWGVPHGPIADMTALVEANGGIVVPSRFDTPHLDAVSVLPRGMPALLFVNAQIPTDRWRNTVGHEIGHLVMHNGPRPDAEGEANRFAAAFLMPRDEIRAELKGPLTLAKLAQLKQRWKVSMQSLVHRAQDLETITPGEAKWLYVQIAQRGWKRVEPVLLPPEHPRVLQDVLALHRDEHGYSFDDLSAKVALNTREFLFTYFPGEGRMRLVD